MSPAPPRARRARALAFGMLAIALAFPAGAAAHALAGRQDLPIPEWLFAWGASLVLIASFVALSMAWRKPRLEDREPRPVAAGLSRAFLNPLTEALAGAIGVFLLGVTIWAGLEGTEAPDRNFALTFVFVTIWIGVPLLTALLGDFFRAFNPWRAVGRAVAFAFSKLSPRPAPPPLTYPEKLGRWPAVIALAGFVWLELVYGATGFQTVGLTPRTVAIAALIYSAYNFIGMALYGIERWLERGEAFNVYFGMFASLSPLEARARRLHARPWLSGATRWVALPGSVAMILLAIGATAFDGAREGTLDSPVATVFDWFLDLGLDPTLALRSANTLFLVATVAAIAAIYWLGVLGMRSVRRADGVRELGRRFAHSFIPIALAYLVSHYFSLIWFQEQAQFTYLLSDPLGDGSNYFGTAGSGIDYGSLGAETVWYIQVASLVIGHVAALVAAHDRALAVYGDHQLASRSQYWMLALMVGFTSLGLFLLSQANG